ncbi:hypothetical protein V8G54_002063 [Vigna mungo]|uniref:SANT domain-containing protein n=1 Tax=Vigna mungo TaxID=3915 RepID=A0AAQ3P8Z1_VIGMU
MESSWTQRQNKEFEKALAKYDIETPDRWQNIANEVGKSVDEVKRQFEILKEDVRRIERGQVIDSGRPTKLKTGDDVKRIRRCRRKRIYSDPVNEMGWYCGGKKWSTVSEERKECRSMVSEGNKRSKELKIEMIG